MALRDELERVLREELFEHDPMCGYEDCGKTAQLIVPAIAAMIRTPPTSTDERKDVLEEAAREDDTFATWTDTMDDEALARYRAGVREHNGHDMASINYNSLRRLITLIDRQRAALTTKGD